MFQDSLNRFKEEVKKVDRETIHITHKSCVDGVGSVLAFRYWCDLLFLPYATVIPVQYGDDVPDVKDKNVIITDFSFSKEELLKMNEEANSIILIDHHKYAKNILKDLDFALFNMDRCGTTLTWQVFMADLKIPKLLKVIEDMDLYTWSHSYSRAIASKLEAFDKTDYVKWYKYLDDDMVSELEEDGKHVLEYKNNARDTICKPYLKHLQTVNPECDFILWEGHIVPFINNTHVRNEIGETLSKEYPFIIQYFFRNGKLIFTFRATNFDLLSLKTPRGHNLSAGCSVSIKDVNMNKLFADNDAGEYIATLLK